MLPVGFIVFGGVILLLEKDEILLYQCIAGLASSSRALDELAEMIKASEGTDAMYHFEKNSTY